MPVVPAPPVPEIPRMEMLLVPELSKFTPGVKRATCEKSLIPRSSRLSCVSAVTLSGTLLRLSSRRVAVTTTSCSVAGAASLEACACSSDHAAQGAQPRTAKATHGHAGATLRSNIDSVSCLLPMMPPPLFEVFAKDHIDNRYHIIECSYCRPRGADASTHVAWTRRQPIVRCSARGSPEACVRACPSQRKWRCTRPRLRTPFPSRRLRL